MWANTPRACLTCAWLCVLIFLHEHNATACACLCMRGVGAAFLFCKAFLVPMRSVHLHMSCPCIMSQLVSALLTAHDSCCCSAGIVSQCVLLKMQLHATPNHCKFTPSDMGAREGTIDII